MEEPLDTPGGASGFFLRRMQAGLSCLKLSHALALKTSQLLLYVIPWVGGLLVKFLFYSEERVGTCSLSNVRTHVDSDFLTLWVILW